MGTLKTILFSIVCLLFVFPLAVSADVMNGGFELGLTNWESNDGVVADDIFSEHPDTAILYAQGVYSSILSQEFTTGGLDILTFTYYGEVFGEAIETDHFYVSLLDSTYNDEDSINQSVDPDGTTIPSLPIEDSLINYGDPANPYFYHWASNTTEEYMEGMVTSVTDEDGWTTISLLLPSGLETATIRFELIHDYREEDASTAVYLDTVQLGTTAVIPVPGAVVLAGFGSFLVHAFRRKNRS